jgi:calcineurin-like phosphoesterase family protein
MSRIFFTSDTHYFHKNIAGPKVSVWKSGYRDFEDEKEMSRHIVKVFNETVAEDDILYHLGDFSFGGIQNIWNFRKQLNCKTIHLILGNHCNHIRDNKILPNVYTQDENDNIFKFYDGSPDPACFNYEVKAQELFTSVQDVLTVKHGQNTFFLSHYSHRTWLGSHKGIIHLWGHSHDTLPMYGKSMDVGIDVAKRLLCEYRPFSIEEIINIMNKRDVKLVDHHNENTNI